MTVVGTLPGRMNGGGRFIVLEGIDGSGKSSQLPGLAAWLRDAGVEVVTCRDPGSTPTGDAVRRILLDDAAVAVDPVAEMLLFMAARAQLVAEVIRPALAAGRWVVCDRFLTATVVYQGHAGGLDPEAIRRVGAVATAGLEPDLEILLDIDAATARARLTRPLDKLESRGPAFRDRLVAGYRSEAARSPCCAVVDGRAPSADVGEAIRQVVATRLRADGGRRTVVGSGEPPFPGHR